MNNSFASFVTFVFFVVISRFSLWSLLFAAEPTNRRVVESGPAEQAHLPPPNATRAVANPPSIVLWPNGQDADCSRRIRSQPLRRWAGKPAHDLRFAQRRRFGHGIAARNRESRIILFRDTKKNGKPDLRQTFLRRLNKAFGMALVDNRFYVGNTDSVVVFPYQQRRYQLRRQPEKILDLPTGGHYTAKHRRRRQRKKALRAVGSATNVDEQRLDEKDSRRAAILEMNSDGSAMRVFAGGMRNPVGMDWEPTDQNSLDGRQRTRHAGRRIGPRLSHQCA